MDAKKIAILSLLGLIAVSFSGCSISKMDEKIGNKNANPNLQQANIDSDSDDLSDFEEEAIGTDKNNSDSDGDKLNDYLELRQWSTNPLNSDSDGDGYSDGQEIENGYDPLGPDQLDSDKDGLGDADEKKFGTDKNNPDTDGDGLLDKEEIDAGRNPLVKE